MIMESDFNYDIFFRTPDNSAVGIFNTHSNAKVAKSHFQKQTVPSPPVDTKYLSKYHQK